MKNRSLPKKKLCGWVGVFLLAMGQSPGWAATYYVSSSTGNDANPGSFSNPWKTIEKVNGFSFQTGDDVYFKCEDTFIPGNYLSVDWEGTANNPTVIGAYYLSGGQPVCGVNGAKPVISGNNYTVPQGAIPVYGGLIKVINHDYITIQDIHLTESRASGIWISGADGDTCLCPVIQRCTITNIYMGAIAISKTPNGNAYIGHNYVHNICLAGNQKLNLYNIHPAGIAIANSPNVNAIIEHNFVCQTYGESISVWCFDNESWKDSGYVIIQDNADFGQGTIYLNGVRDIVVRRNLVIGGNESGTLYDGVRFNKTGIGVSDENVPTGTIPENALKNIEIYDNWIGNCRVGIFLNSEEGVDGLKDQVRNIKVYNNKLIANYTGITILNHKATYFDSEIKNNVLYAPANLAGNYDLLCGGGTTAIWNGDLNSKGYIPKTTTSHFPVPSEFTWQNLSETDFINIPVEVFRKAFDDGSALAAPRGLVVK